MAAVAPQSDARSRWLDRAAIVISVLCLVQCLLLPVAVVALPFMSAGVLSHELLHVVVLGVVLPLSLAAFLSGWRRHGRARMLVPGVAGLGVLILAALLGREVLGTAGEALVTSAGGVLLILAHSWNLIDGRRAGHSHR